MKKINLVSALAATLVLAACTQSQPKTEAPMEMKKPVETTKTVVYSCLNKKSLTAVYTFMDQNPVSAVVKLGKKGKEIELKRDDANKDFASFTDGQYIWNVDTDLTLDNFDKAAGSNFTQTGKKVDRILAKLCNINTKATAAIN